MVEQEEVKHYDTSSTASTKHQSIVTKVEAVEYTLWCTLEELYKGDKNYVAYPRFVLDPSGVPTMEEIVITVMLKPWWKKGSKVTFPEAGNQKLGLTQGDLIFVIDEETHPTFTRDGDDLKMTKNVSLDDDDEALTTLTGRGRTFDVTTLDGRKLIIDVPDVVESGHEVVIPGEGMRNSEESMVKGNLRIILEPGV